jgi:hypothetical protein
LTTWLPRCLSISAMTRWVSQKNPPRLTPVTWLPAGESAAPLGIR